MKQILFKNLFIAAILLLLVTGCTNRNAPAAESKKVLTDTVFYSTFNRVPLLQFPCSFKSMPDDSELVRLGFPGYVQDTYKFRTADSLFLNKYICEFDNFCEFKKMAIGVEYGLYKGIKLNDSIYIITYFEYDERWSRYRNKETQPKLFLLSYNVNKSKKPVGKLVLYAYEKGRSELWSTIDSDFNIETNHHLSWKDLYKQYPGLELYDVELTFIIRKYHLKASGEFELYNFIDGGRRGVQYEDQHFTKNDTVYLRTAWEKDIQGKIKQIAKFRDHGFIINNKFILTDTTARPRK